MEYKSEQELEEEYSNRLKQFNTYEEIDNYMDQLSIENKEILNKMINATHEEMVELHKIKFAVFSALREAKHKKVSIFKSTHKRPKF